jgi:hypothetical protein
MKFIPTAVSLKFGRQLLHLKKNSPQVMFAGGVATGLASTVLACRATLKLSETLLPLEELKERSELRHEEFTQGVGVGHDRAYDDKQYSKDQTVIKVKTILTVSKLYAPAAGLAMISVGLLTGSHVTLNRRNASLTAAYASVDQAFAKYRERVTEELGAEQDEKFRHGTRTVEEVVEGTDGKKKTVKKQGVSTDSPSGYARFFDQTCGDLWKPQPEYNRIFLQAQQNYANHLLQARGHLFLNEVYDMLGMERSGAGAVVGWLHGPKGGDQYVDFGIFSDDKNPNVRDFVNGLEASILLDFNVDGTIFDKIGGPA